MVFEVGITLFIHLMCIFSLFAWCSGERQLERADASEQGGVGERKAESKRSANGVICRQFDSHILDVFFVLQGHQKRAVGDYMYLQINPIYLLLSDI